MTDQIGAWVPVLRSANADADQERAFVDEWVGLGITGWRIVGPITLVCLRDLSKLDWALIGEDPEQWREGAGTIGWRAEAELVS